MCVCVYVCDVCDVCNACMCVTYVTCVACVMRALANHATSQRERREQRRGNSQTLHYARITRADHGGKLLLDGLRVAGGGGVEVQKRLRTGNGLGRDCGGV